MSMNDKDDSLDLELWFSASRKHTADPSDDLLARVLGDAARMQPQAPGIMTAAPVLVPKPSLWAQFMNAIGGWSGLAGLGTATVAGLWIGISPPAMLQSVSSALTQTGNYETTYINAMDEYAALMIEGDQ